MYSFHEKICEVSDGGSWNFFIELEPFYPQLIIDLDWLPGVGED
jgi:hypothetical protein